MPRRTAVFWDRTRHHGVAATADKFPRAAQIEYEYRSRNRFRPARMTKPSSVLPDGVRADWRHEPHFARVNGWRMHYVDEGRGDPVVLLHGNPTWGFLYRDFVTPLTEAGYRVVIPDMIGFGLSEKPIREHAHSLDGHIANLTGLLRGLDLGRITLVCHDWGGPTGLGFALANLTRMKALVLMSTWAWPLPPAEFHTRMFPWRMMHAPLVGPSLLGRHNALAGRGISLSVVDRERFRARAQGAYEAVLPDPASRLLTWTWPRWIPLDETARALERFRWLERELASCKLPTLLVWGREDDVFDGPTFCARFKALLPHAEGPHMVTGRHFLQEDSGPQIATAVTEFLKRLDFGGHST
jgi:pimeloyl-ACP methyl ester carboxylesterase